LRVRLTDHRRVRLLSPGGQPAARFRLACAGLVLIALTVAATSVGRRSAAAAADAGKGSPATSPLTSPPSSQPTLITAAAVRALSPAQAAARLPVRVRGTLTYIANQPSILFLQDATGGVAVIGPRDPAIRKQLRPGAQIEVEGVTAAGRQVGYVAPRGREPIAITVLDGVAPMAAAPVAVTDLLASTRHHGELVEVQGVVRTVRTEAVGPTTPQDALVVTLAAAGGGRLVAAWVPWPPTAPVPAAWVGATVRFRGVFNSAGPDKQPVATMRLLLGGKADALVLTSAPAAVATPVAGVDAAAGDEENARRARVAGAVTLVVPGRGMYVQDDSGGVWVDTADAGGGPAADAVRTASSATPPAGAPSAAVPAAGASTAGSPALPAAVPKVGDAVEVVGFPARRAGAAVVEDAVWRTTGRAPPPAPVALTADAALAGGYHARLVAVDALVLEVSRLSEGPTLVLQSGERVFLARLADPGDARPLAGVAENSWVRVTGVCVNNRRPADGGLAGQPVSFHLLLPDAAAVRVIHAPGWWTLERVLIGTAAALLLAVAALAWVVALRRRVTLQTAQIRGHVQQQSVSEERMRIARELHDSLEQDLLGITLQLKATDKLLGRPDKARESLTLASAMVRRTQAETHRAVWDLRERQEGLVPTLRSAVAGLTAGAAHAGGPGGGGGPAVEVRVAGAERPLPPQTENHLLRVALEAVTNAFKHAAATSVFVDVGYEPGRVAIEVHDDGRGFDADHPPAPVSGHFGLFGMRERAAKLHGELTVVSRTGHGSTIRLVVPTDVANGNGHASLSGS
jgi:signal transduction histidine kinase